MRPVGVVVSEKKPNKLEIAKCLKKCKGGVTFLKVLEATKALNCFS